MATSERYEPEPLARKPAPETARTEEVGVPDDLAVFVVRGTSDKDVPMLFVPGMCVHPAGYVMSFQRAAAAHGNLVGVQGDLSCGGDGSMRKWSYDLAKMDRRIDAAFAAAGLGLPHDVIVIGYSQGAERAEKLVARWPEKYSRAILIASPVAPSVQSLGRAESVVFMAGTSDMSFSRMRKAASILQDADVPATFLPMANARHGEMGDTPDETMRDALDFVTKSP